MSIEKNQQALTQAFKATKGKRNKIKELGIKPGMSGKAIDKLIEDLSIAKAVEKSADMADFVAGQRWYVEGLVKFSGKTIAEQMALEYDDAFAESASEVEMLEYLNAM